MGYGFYSTCVNWGESDVRRDGGLCDMIDDGIDITRRTFLRHVGAEQVNDIAESLGYSRHPSQGLTMAADWHISYHRSKLHGKRVYFFKWSGIEHVFTQQQEH